MLTPIKKENTFFENQLFSRFLGYLYFLNIFSGSLDFIPSKKKKKMEENYLKEIIFV